MTPVLAEDATDTTPVPYDPVFFEAEKEKVDTASISVILLDHQEVPGTEGNDTMTVYIMNTKTRLNSDKVFAGTDKNEYLDTASCTLVFIRRDGGAVIAAQTYGDFDSTVAYYPVGSKQELVNDTGLGHRAMGRGEVVAVQQGAKLKGDPSGKYASVPLYVFK